MPVNYTPQHMHNYAVHLEMHYYESEVLAGMKDRSRVWTASLCRTVTYYIRDRKEDGGQS